jgi:transient receptor potential cation channel subfamily A member 1
MGKYRDVIDIQQGGEHGRTALHLAAIYDHEECARILVSLPRDGCGNSYQCFHSDNRIRGFAESELQPW